ncbi:hypothetical protein FIBSPDRAFT_782242 [Athelia psychrophila]|uniref:MYND-type domain-containing protein n=1 Tax=Athelia psychrophila TaxID=1759441 RepID=A0A166PQ74_9AGAM|nr:hypothetical protein FIBSPDRAFT_782242 [Fibularhizoctonia sp. CBS 109695]
MATPLYWPGRYFFFYPIGHTSAVCLTRDLPPEEPAHILLLGCGDPRSIFYTIYSETDNGEYRLPACLPACLSYSSGTMLISIGQLPERWISQRWERFTHWSVPAVGPTHRETCTPCKKLLQISDSTEKWAASPYGTFLKFCTDYTLAELRRHWLLYVDMQELPRQQAKSIRDAFTEQMKQISKKAAGGSYSSSASRSAGPLMMDTIKTASEVFTKYWRNGTTFSDPKQIAAATVLNPTFVYSLGGEGFNVHYGTDPMVPFHHAHVFGNAKRTVSASDMVKSAKKAFDEWCAKFAASISSTTSPTPIIRIFLGDATAVCRVLRAHADTGAIKSSVPVAQWRVQLIQLNKETYSPGGAPSKFNVVDTSNLENYMGLLNVLIASVPLLSSRSSVLYTESLRPLAKDATKEFRDQLYADITTMALMLDLCPIDYLSGFTSRSNSHELLAYTAQGKAAGQFHRVTTWKSPLSGDLMATRNGAEFSPSPTFDPHQLGTLLYDVYHLLFEQEDSPTFYRLNEKNIKHALATANIIHYMRASFVLLLNLIRERLRINPESWLAVMDRFFSVAEADHSCAMDTLNIHDLCALLYHHGVYKHRDYDYRPPKIGRFVGWTTVPPLVRIILTVPREKVQVLWDHAEKVPTPTLQCDVGGKTTLNIFTAIHVAFGRVIPMGTKARPWVSFEEDPAGFHGSSPLLVSFIMPTRLLTDFEPAEDINVEFCIKSLPGIATHYLLPILGVKLSIFSARLMDQSLVQVLPEQPLSPIPAGFQKRSSSSPTQIGASSAISIDLDEECELVDALTSRISVENQEARRLFAGGAMPQIQQLSGCVLQVTLGHFDQRIVYPFPVIGSQHKLRVARKSQYIEVVVPISGPFKADGMQMNRYPVIGVLNGMTPWNIHRLHLPSLPILDMKANHVDKWLLVHVFSTMSMREKSLKEKKGDDVLLSVKDTINSIFVLSSGIQGGVTKRVFSLHNSKNSSDTIIFVSDIRYDLHSHTMVCDGYVLPLTSSLVQKLSVPLGSLAHSGSMANLSQDVQSWKQLLPALVERCRFSWSHGPNCEYTSKDRIPLSEDIESDPLCSCGRGKDVDGMLKDPAWSKFAPYVTRMALSPLFAVSYLETVMRNPEERRCFVCRKKGKMKTCTKCQKVRYCGPVCQKRDWKLHKEKCKP